MIFWYVLLSMIALLHNLMEITDTDPSFVNRLNGRCMYASSTTRGPFGLLLRPLTSLISLKFWSLEWHVTLCWLWYSLKMFLDDRRRQFTARLLQQVKQPSCSGRSLPRLMSSASPWATCRQVRSDFRCAGIRFVSLATSWSFLETKLTSGTHARLATLLSYSIQSQISGFCSAVINFWLALQITSWPFH